ncbi:hypothetical protein [Sphingomonas azotifigens]|uniref:hypothetical protein n=1 Tax=Sphingomonas azotifigens TaxID=330920 RepID=UPI00111C6441|nr:hypothetical protein [Sphingomonas azotifigens]
MTSNVLLDGAKKRFGFETWPRRVGAEAEPRTRGLALTVADGIGAWVLERRLPYGDGGYADYYQETGRPQHRVMIRVTEHADHDEALQVLLELLSMSMAVSLPRFKERGGGIGDIAFTGHDDLISVLFFVRHNVLIDLRSIGDEPVSVRSFADVVDGQILAAAS